MALARRGGSLLTDEITRLRWAVAVTRAERPFAIGAWVVLPDHMHCIWTLPAGDPDFSTRWRLIKARFSRGLPEGPLRRSHVSRQERGIWQRRFWEHHIRDPVSDTHLDVYKRQEFGGAGVSAPGDAAAEPVGDHPRAGDAGACLLYTSRCV